MLGALIVFARRPSPRALGLVMGFGAGVLLSAIAFELVEESVSLEGARSGPVLGFFAGAFVYYLGDTALSGMGYHKRKDVSGEATDASGLSIVLGAALDGIPESAALGLMLLQTGNVSFGILVAVLVSNLPEAVAATQGLLGGGWSKGRVILLWTGIVVISGLAAAVGFATLDSASPAVLSFVMAFAGGAMLAMLATTMMPEAFEHAGRATGLATVLGFAVAYAITLTSG